MDNENLMYVNLSDLDLNQEPMDSVTTVESFLTELDNAQELIEERIRQLAVCERQRQERNFVEMMVDLNNISNNSTLDRTNSIRAIESTGRGCKRDGSHLVARALEIDSELKKDEKDGGCFYDCNICLDMAKDPVLTCCGHLFCWPCFYQVSNVDSTSKECPVCKGEVSESAVIPIYGNCVDERPREFEYGLKLPPRPKAPRVESIRQQRVTRRISRGPIEEALRQIRVSIGDMGIHTRQEEGGDGVHQASSVLSESAASLSSITSALSSVDRLVEDFERVISRWMSRNDRQTAPVAFENPSSDALFVDPSPQSTDVYGSDLRILTRRDSIRVNTPVALPPSLRTRRRIVSRYANGRESIRRRLN